MAEASGSRSVRTPTPRAPKPGFFSWLWHAICSLFSRPARASAPSPREIRIAARELEATGKHRAAALYEELLRMDPHDVSAAMRLAKLYATSDPARAALLFEGAAEDFARRGHYEKALALTQRAIAINPARGQVRRLAAEIMLNRGQYAEAFDAFTAAANVFDANGEHAAAAEVRERAAEAEAFFSQARIKRA